MTSRLAPVIDEATSAPRILVVDDDWLIRDLISTVLREDGAVVAEAADADEAWKHLTAGSPVDLVFTDHNMPGSMNGAQLAALIRRELPGVDVVVVSGDWQSVEWREPVLPKPYHPEKTAAELARRALIARRKHESGIAATVR